MTHACTIIAGNYLAAARVLAESFFAHHPDGSFAILVVDDEAREIAPAGDLDRRIDWWRLADLGLDAAAIHCLAGIYEVSELSTSVKPLFLRCLLRAGAPAVIYLDPDIQVFGSLAYVPRLAERHGLVLTPHVTQPIPDDGRDIDALFVLAAGVYNLGFAAVGASAVPCLEWWWQQTRRRALIDVGRQMFTDQRWADYMPSLFSHVLLKDPAYNAAYWNLHERPLTRAHGRLFARNEPLRFFHFSGFDPRTPWLLSKHQGERPRHLLSEMPVLAEVCEEYAAALDRAGFAASSQRRYGWEISADGLAMTHRIRRIYWAGVMAAELGEAAVPPDPFDAEHAEAFTAWLNAPDERESRRWSRYLHAIYQARPDVRAHMPAIEGTDAARFANWLRSDGVVQEHIPPALTPTAPVIAVADSMPEDGAAPLAEGLNVAGYFHAELGVGEAARLLTRAIDATGSAYTTSAQLAPRSRQQHRFEAREPTGGAPFDINILCVNADATPGFAREAGPAFFAGRHTIGYWFWEVDPLPAAMHGAFDVVDEVWAATDYVAGILRAASAGRTPVFTVPLPLTGQAPPAPFTREQLGLPVDRFVFLFAFDFLSVMERKNPLGAIEAFCAAFAPGEGPVLVLKSINGKTCLPQLERLRRAAAHRSDILIRDGYVSAEEKNALVAACDCYVSLHRAEGLGLTLAEAMALGKPAIATGYSGNRHFMTDENSFLVEYRLASAAGDCGPYPPESRWAEPDLSHAAELMRTVYRQPGEAARRAERGRTDLLLRHGVMTSAAAIEHRLRDIRRERAAAAAEEEARAADLAATLAAAPLPIAVPVTGPDPTLADAAMRAAALEAFSSALPHLYQMRQPHLTNDERPWQGARRAAQRTLFRVMRPYWYQQRQFQDALLEAVRGSLERLAAPPPSSSPEPAPPPVVDAAAPEPPQDAPAPQDEPALAAPARTSATRDLWTSAIVFLCCMIVFNANGRVISAGDSIAARYQPFGIWGYGTTLLDPIAALTAQGFERPTNWNPQPGSAYWMVPTKSGHFVSLYSAVLPVMISPLYLPAVTYLHFRGWTDERIDILARIMEKVSASTIAALSASLLYLLLRRGAPASTALLLTVAYAFGTTTWVIGSQALWQHGLSELLLVGLLLLLTGPCTVPGAMAAGVLCALIAANRPANAVLVAPLGVYALFWAGRRAAVVAGAALVAVLPLVIHNLSVVGALGGAYVLVGRATFMQHDMIQGVAGLLFSPTRGLFVFSPFLLFLVLLWRHPPRDRAARGLTLAIAAGVVVQVLLYSKSDWRGGVSWGPRFLTDLLPLLLWLLVPVVVALSRRGRAVFVTAVALAIAIESVGAFAYTGATDAAIFASDSGANDLHGAWEWRNAPFLASLSHGLAPAEIATPMRGAIESFEVAGRPVSTVVAGQDIVALGWGIAGHATPMQVGITIDGLHTTAVHDFYDRPDIRRALPGAGRTGWRIPISTAGLTPGEHRFSLYLWASEKGEGRFLGTRTLTVAPAPPEPIVAASRATAQPSDPGLEASFKTAVSRVHEHQKQPGYWLTTFTSATRYVEPHDEMNTYLTSVLVDLLDPLAGAGLGDSVQRARLHLTAQIENSGLVRYHGLPDGPTIGTLGCAITPDTDDTALVWRIAPAHDYQRLSAALAVLDAYRRPDGLYRTWLAPREKYQCLDPGRDPNPADIGIQMHLLQMLLPERPAAGRALCDALRQHVDDDKIWVYYQVAPLVPMLRTRDLERAGCPLQLPAARMKTTVPEQQAWISLIGLLSRASQPGGSRADAGEATTLLRQLADNDFALLRQNPPMLYHNDLTATVSRYYWSEDAGYALWLRLAYDAAHVGHPPQDVQLAQ